MNEPLPPADQDYGEVEAQYQGDDITPISEDDIDPENESSIAPQVIGRTAGELRELQRLLMSDARSLATKPSERAQCARAYKEIEMLRRAIRGNPVLMAQPVKAEARGKRKTPAIAMLSAAA